jgi:NAD(P)-dependent dehydrogenase (short-subunit alcohol dehydrogenase family)
MKTWEELFDFSGSVAILTGGAMGIGEAIARRLAAQGASVVVADIDESKGDMVVRELAELGKGKPLFVRTDVRDVSQAERLVKTAVQECGHLDILINNAGIYPIAPAMSVTPELWNRVLEVNLRGPFFLAQAAARKMKGQGSGGSIVNIASIDALHPTGQLAAYDASKGGLRMLTRSLALELSPLNIRVNAIAPGSIATPGAAATSAGASPAETTRMLESFTSRTPLRRVGEPDDIACAALFLASRAASYITGVTLVVDGGYLLS